MPDEPRVQELLDELLDRQATPEEVCGASPELLPVVRQRWQQICRARTELDALLPIWPHRSLPTTPPEDLSLPQVPGYEVDSVLGLGGMGVVYRVRHLKLNRTVALKTLLAGAYAGPAERTRFQREAEAVAGLCHASIVQVYEVGEHEGRPYFTMELIDGGSLAQKLTAAPPTIRRAAELVASLAEAVSVAHSAGIVHRDLKPANILLTAGGTPKISDFGVARRMAGEAALTATGTPVGTPSYMAPEQVSSAAGSVGPATDVHGLGAVLYELLTGRPPFCAESAMETFRQVLADEPVPPSRLNSRVPRDLESVCLKCLQKEPQRRYASAQALAEDLRRYLLGQVVAARPVGGLEWAAKWARRRPTAAAMLAVAVLLVVTGVVGGGLLYRQRADDWAREAKTDPDVRVVLGRARDLLEEGWQAADLEKLRQARSEADRAANMARSDGASAAVLQEAYAIQKDATARLERAERNRALLEALQDVSVRNETLTYVYGSQEVVGELGQSGVSVQNETLTYIYGRANSPLWLAQVSADESYGAVFRRWGLDVDGTAEVEVVARLGAEPDPVVQELVAGLDCWMLERRRNHPEAVGRQQTAPAVAGAAGRRGAPACGGRGRAGRDRITVAGAVGAVAQRHLAGALGTAAGDRSPDRDRIHHRVTGRRARRGGGRRGGGAGVAPGGDGAAEGSRPAHGSGETA
jgi:tRNA A-37 threonylcarbamoyl transferase component Bud32